MSSWWWDLTSWYAWLTDDLEKKYEKKKHENEIRSSRKLTVKTPISFKISLCVCACVRGCIWVCGCGHADWWLGALHSKCGWRETISIPPQWAPIKIALPIDFVQWGRTFWLLLEVFEAFSVNSGGYILYLPSTGMFVLWYLGRWFDLYLIRLMLNRWNRFGFFTKKQKLCSRRVLSHFSHWPLTAKFVSMCCAH